MTARLMGFPFRPPLSGVVTRWLCANQYFTAAELRREAGEAGLTMGPALTVV